MLRKFGVLFLTAALAGTMLLAGCSQGTKSGTANSSKSASSSGSSSGGKSVSESSGSSSSSGGDQKKAKTVTLNLVHTQVGKDKATRLHILQDAVKAAEQSDPGLTIKMEGVNDNVWRNQKLRAEMAVGSQPQIFDLFGGTDTQLYAKSGHLLALNDILNELGLTDQFIDLSAFTVNGKIYGLPIGGSVEGFFYNKTLFKKLNLQPPKTWDDLNHIIQVTKAHHITPFAMASKAAWVPLMLANTLWVRDEGLNSSADFVSGKQKWTDPGMLKAFKQYNQWVKDGDFYKGSLGMDYNEQRNQLIAGKAAMMFDGSWTSTVFKDKTKIGNQTFGFFKMPPVPGGVGDQTSINGQYGNGYGFSADITPAQKAGIKAFIKAQYNEKMQRRGLLEDNVLPSMKVKDMSGIDPLMKEIIQASNSAGSQFAAFDQFVQPDVNKAISDGIQQIIGQHESPEKMLEAVQKVQDTANQAKK